MSQGQWVRPRQQSTRPRSKYQEHMARCLADNRAQMKGSREQRTETFKACVAQWREKKKNVSG